MFDLKLTRVLVSALFATAALSATACDKGGGSTKKKSERLRWVNKPTTGTTENEGKTIKIPGLAVDFYTPDVLYVYKDCQEPAHSPEAGDKSWIPVVRCTSPFGSDDEEEDWDSEEEEEDGNAGAEMTIYVTEKANMLINERAKTMYETEYKQAGFEVDSVEYFDEYLAKPGRRGIEILAHTVNSETGYPEREIHRFMFPKDDVLFIVHVDYPYGNDRSGINSDWERIIWNFQFSEDGPLFGE